MILIRTPLRIELLAGGTDGPAFHHRKTGYVLSVTIDKFIHIALNQRFVGGLRVSYDELEQVSHRDEVKHTRTKAALARFNIKHGLDINSITDVPYQGCGLGSSTCFTVGLVHALSVFQNKKMTPRELAEMAFIIEIEDVGDPIGKQDYYPAAFGGLNLLKFYKNRPVHVGKIRLNNRLKKKFHDHILVFWTGKTHSTREILQKQTITDAERFPHLSHMSDLAVQGAQAIKKGDMKTFGKLLSEEWETKKKAFSGITNNEIETMLRKAKQAGAWGGRLSGAGAGGFMIFAAPPAKHEKIMTALKGYQSMPVKIYEQGSKVIKV